MKNKSEQQNHSPVNLHMGTVKYYIFKTKPLRLAADKMTRTKKPAGNLPSTPLFFVLFCI